VFSAKIVSIYRLRLILCFTYTPYTYTHPHNNESSSGAKEKGRGLQRERERMPADLYASIPHFYFFGCHLAKIFHISTASPSRESSAPSSSSSFGCQAED